MLLLYMLDYCNALYSVTCKGNIHRLQLIQNAASRLLTALRGVTTSHQSLLPFTVYQWVLGFILRFYYMFIKALNGLATAYVCDLLTPYEPDRFLSSSVRALPRVPNLVLSLKVTGPLLFEPLGCGTPCLEIPGRQTMWLLLNLI